MSSRKVRYADAWVDVGGESAPPIFNEDAIVAAALAAGAAPPRHYVRLTGENPLLNEGNGGNGFLGNAPRADVTEMNGGAYVTSIQMILADVNESTSGSTHSWAAWMKWLHFGSSTGDVQGIMNHGNAPDSFSSRSFQITIGSDRLLSLHRFSGSNSAGSLASVPIPDDSEWHMLGCSYASGQQKFYLDGVLDPAPTNAALTGSLNSSSTRPIYVGARQGGLSVSYGPLAHVAYWPEVLSDAAFADMFDSRLIPL